MDPHRFPGSADVVTSDDAQRSSGKPEPGDRLEVHNASVDEDLAEAGACGQVHLPTGRACIQPHHHHGSCAFAETWRTGEP